MTLPTFSTGAAARLLITAALALSLTSVPASAGGTEPGPAGSPGPTVTLLTGDRVTVGPARNGEPTVLVEPRAGGSSGFSVRRAGPGQVSVVPNDVAALVPDVLDPALFDVTGLIEMGYDDEHRADLPVIVRDAPGARTTTALAERRALPSIGATAGVMPKGAFGAARTFGTQQTRIWLDRRVGASTMRGSALATRDGYLDQIKAPSAWAVGLDGKGVKVAVLDTGVDADHPALAGKVAVQSDFTGGADPADGNGHGTHVASLIAGSGAGSDGARQGIAPAAELLSAKVLADDGFGQESWVIAGMEWAVAQQADVVNLSLGGRAGETDDVVAQALDRLTAQSGTLFVVAAGNRGGLGADPYTIDSPGIAASALTVGAVGANDRLALFSSEGPTRGSYRLKPELTAPGVSLLGARAGARDGNLYVAMSGTSQATPVVAGAAALLFQQDPNRSGQQVKARLASTADPASVFTAWSGGNGRLDLQKATSSSLAADLASIDFGYLKYPDEAVRSRTLTLTNDGAEPVTVSIAEQETNDKGVSAPADAVVATPATLTVPAGGTATTTLTLDPALLPDGSWQGSVDVLGSDQEKLLHFGFNVYDEPERYDLTVHAVDRAGQPFAGGTVTTFNAVTGGFRNLQLDESGTAKVRVDRGYYSIFAQIVTPAAEGRPETFAVAGSPEVAVTTDTTYTVDARRAEPLRAPTVELQPTKVVEASLSYSRHAGTRGYSDFAFFTPEQIAAGTVFVQPTAPVAHGDFEASTRWRLEPIGTVRSGDPSIYELAFPRDHFPPLTPQLDRQALQDMARTETTFGTYSGAGTQLAGRVWSTARTGVGWVSWRPVEVPSKRVELLSADPAAEWSLCLRTPGTGTSGLCPPQWVSYTKGQDLRSVFGTALHPQPVNAYHNPSTFFAEVGVGDAFHEAKLAANAVENPRLALYRDGTLVAEKAALYGYFPVPTGSGSFRLEQSWALQPAAFATGTRSAETSWQLTSAPPADPTQASATTPSLLTIGYDADVDGYGRAAAWHPLRVDLRIGHLTNSTTGGRITGARLWYSADDGQTWSAAPVVPIPGAYRAIVPPGAMRQGGSLSVRVTATDSGGGSIDQTVIGMIPVK